MLISCIIEIQSRILDRKFIDMTWHAMDISSGPPLLLLLVRVDYIHHWWEFIQYPSFHRYNITIMSWWLCNCGLAGLLIYSMDHKPFHSCNILAIGIFSCRLYCERKPELWFSHLVVSQSVSRPLIGYGDNLNRRDTNRVAFEIHGKIDELWIGQLQNHQQLCTGTLQPQLQSLEVCTVIANHVVPEVLIRR